MIDVNAAVNKPLRLLKESEPGQWVVLRSFKRDRAVAVRRLPDLKQSQDSRNSDADGFPHPAHYGNSTPSFQGARLKNASHPTQLKTSCQTAHSPNTSASSTTPATQAPETYTVVEAGFRHARTDIPFSKVRQTLKKLVKREFPRSNKLRLHVENAPPK